MLKRLEGVMINQYTKEKHYVFLLYNCVSVLIIQNDIKTRKMFYRKYLRLHETWGFGEYQINLNIVELNQSLSEQYLSNT